MSISDKRVSVTVSSFVDFAAAVPALVGFYPTESVVAVFLRGNQLVVTIRVDRPDPLDRVSALVTKTAHRVGADQVVLAVFSTTISYRTDDGQVTALVSTCAAQDIRVLDAVVIAEDRCWSLLDNAGRFRPSAAAVLPDRTTPLEAQRVATGQAAVADSRSAIEARFQARPDLAPSKDAFHQARDVWNLPLTDQAALAWECLRLLASKPRLQVAGSSGDLLRARLAVLVSDGRVRDFVLCSVASCSDDVDELVDAAVTTALRTPADFQSPIAATAAALLAACGDSTVPVRCLLELAEGMILADLIDRALANAIPPATLRQWMRDSMPTAEQALREQSA